MQLLLFTNTTLSNKLGEKVDLFYHNTTLNEKVRCRFCLWLIKSGNKTKILRQESVKQCDCFDTNL